MGTYVHTHAYVRTCTNAHTQNTTHKHRQTHNTHTYTDTVMLPMSQCQTHLKWMIVWRAKQYLMPQYSRAPRIHSWILHSFSFYCFTIVSLSWATLIPQLVTSTVGLMCQDTWLCTPAHHHQQQRWVLEVQSDSRKCPLLSTYLYYITV